MKSTGPIYLIEQFILGGRWMLAILYALMNIGLAIYAGKFAIELYHMVAHMGELNTEMTMLALLGLVDIAMVANLVIMVNCGGYSIFVRELSPEEIPGRPRFMRSVTSSGLKIKMMSSLVGISSIHLLKQFIHASSGEEGVLPPTWNLLFMMIVLHLVFVASTVALALVDKLTHPAVPAGERHS